VACQSIRSSSANEPTGFGGHRITRVAMASHANRSKFGRRLAPIV
jgi:hypothetical protein